MSTFIIDKPKDATTFITQVLQSDLEDLSVASDSPAKDELKAKIRKMEQFLDFMKTDVTDPLVFPMTNSGSARGVSANIPIFLVITKDKTEHYLDDDLLTKKLISFLYKDGNPDKGVQFVLTSVDNLFEWWEDNDGDFELKGLVRV